MLKFAGHPSSHIFRVGHEVGFGEDFERIQSFIRKQKEFFASQFSMSDLFNSIKQTILSLRENSREDGDRVHDIAIKNALNFIEHLSLEQGIKTPLVISDGDQGVAFEWRTNSREILVITLTPDNNILYACLESDGEFHGSKSFEKEKIPSNLLHYIRSISLL